MLNSIKLKNKILKVPIIQGGMGVGISNLIIFAPLISSGNNFTDSIAGLIFSPPKGSNPLTKIHYHF